MPSGIPSSGGLAADEQLDGPVLALLTTAQQQQAGGDLNGASSSLERAQRVAPREPQVLYRLAQVRMAQQVVELQRLLHVLQVMAAEFFKRAACRARRPCAVDVGAQRQVTDHPAHGVYIADVRVRRHADLDLEAAVTLVHEALG